MLNVSINEDIPIYLWTDIKIYLILAYISLSFIFEISSSDNKSILFSIKRYFLSTKSSLMYSVINEKWLKISFFETSITIHINLLFWICYLNFQLSIKFSPNLYLIEGKSNKFKEWFSKLIFDIIGIWVL